MHIPTHILSGWCVGNLAPLDKRDRLLAMIAGAVWDLDGLSIIGGRESYWDYHHVLGHNVLIGVIVSGLIALLARRRLMMVGVSLLLFHLHMVMDYLGSGPGWGISYLWPFSEWQWQNHADWVWEFDSWQNRAAAGALLFWTVIIARFAGRTPLELLAPSFDRMIVSGFRGKRAAEKMTGQETRAER